MMKLLQVSLETFSTKVYTTHHSQSEVYPGLSLTCPVNGYTDPGMHVIWEKDGDMISNGPPSNGLMLNITEVCTLSFQSRITFFSFNETV